MRQISYAESLRFEKLHEEEYRRLGFSLVDIWPADPAARATAISEYVGTPAIAVPTAGVPRRSIRRS